MPADQPGIIIRRLADELRAQRTRAGLTTQQVTERLGWSLSRLTRLEAADATKPVLSTISELLDLYGTTGDDRARIVDLVKTIHKRGWWQQYRDVLPGTLYDYISLQSDATAIRSFDTSTIPGPLRTSAYMRALLTARTPAIPADRLGRLMEVHEERCRRLFERDRPPLVWAVIDEAVLLRRFADEEVMREQFEHLRKILQPHRVHISILPLDAPVQPAAGPFALLTFPGSPGQEAAYIQTVTGGVWALDDDARTVGTAFELLVAASTSEAETRAYLGALIDGKRPPVRAGRSRRTRAGPAAAG